MARKVALFAFNGEPTCFIHVLLNSLDMEEQGYSVKVIIEGAATAIITGLHEKGTVHPLNPLYQNVKSHGLIDAVCLACATKMHSIDAVKAEGLPIAGTLNGHPAMSTYLNDGHEIITF
ncbi:cytoplasmic protein [Candidatus Bathyarchaeota archaeon]|nr:cytoplasmic protein [Candidatus Bathyarchaeota archaeon]